MDSTSRRFEIAVTEVARRDLEALDETSRDRVLNSLRALAENPRAHKTKKLPGFLGFRIRAGEQRIIYEISENRIVIAAIRTGHRREAYKNPALPGTGSNHEPEHKL